jgi:hypothetical protein
MGGVLVSIVETHRLLYVLVRCNKFSSKTQGVSQHSMSLDKVGVAVHMLRQMQELLP